jgi:hypothetical protein
MAHLLGGISDALVLVRAVTISGKQEERFLPSPQFEGNADTSMRDKLGRPKARKRDGHTCKRKSDRKEVPWATATLRMDQNYEGTLEEVTANRPRDVLVKCSDWPQPNSHVRQWACPMTMHDFKQQVNETTSASWWTR